MTCQCIYDSTLGLGFPMLLGVRDQVGLATRLRGHNDRVEFRERDMNDMFWEIPKEEAMAAIRWAMTTVREKTRGKKAWFSIARGGEKDLDRVGSCSSRNFYVLSEHEVLRFVDMDLKLKPEFVGHKIRRRPYPAPKEQADEIERQIQECIDAGLVLEYKDGDYPLHCSPCFLVAKPGSTAKRLVVDYGELNKKTLNHSGSIPNMESTLEKIASCRYKTKMDKRSGLWQVDLTPNAQELLAFITPQGRVFKWKVMPFGVANAPALFQELMNKILFILRRRPKVQELISRGAQMEAHIDDVCLGTNTQEDHLILLGEFFAVCQENHTRLKLEKCEFSSCPFFH